MTGSTEEEIDAFYKTLEEAKSQCKPNEVNIIIGDLNAKVGSGTDGRTVGPHGTGERNKHGEKWVHWCDSKTIVIMNTMVQGTFPEDHILGRVLETTQGIKLTILAINS